MASEQQHKGSSRSEEEDVSAPPADAEAVAARKEQIDSEVDDILDEIDGVLEENAAEFVSSFVQKGGE
jgi:prokaryotic ubiquitin-like protein Pup